MQDKESGGLREMGHGDNSRSHSREIGIPEAIGRA